MVDVEGAHRRVLAPVAASPAAPRARRRRGRGAAPARAPRAARSTSTGPATNDWQARASPAATSAAVRRPWSRRSRPSPATVHPAAAAAALPAAGRRDLHAGRRGRVQQRRAGRHLGHLAAGQEGHDDRPARGRRAGAGLAARPARRRRPGPALSPQCAMRWCRPCRTSGAPHVLQVGGDVDGVARADHDLPARAAPPRPRRTARRPGRG